MHIGYGGGLLGAVLALTAALGTAATAAADPPPPPVDPPSVVDSILGQTPVPALPGTEPGFAPNLNPLNNAYLLPQNVEPAAPGQGQVVGVAPGDENADVARWDYLRRLWATYQEGGLTGGLLGQAPG